MRRKGFTLIELLVVIAIIGILAAMLFPVFARARESARKTQCLANVKNIAMAVQIYLSDYDAFPPNNHDPDLFAFLNANSSTNRGKPDFCVDIGSGRYNGANPYLRWPVILDEYIKSREVFMCPSIQHVSTPNWIVPQYTPVWWHYLQDTLGHWGRSDPNCAGGPCCRAWPPGWGGTVTDSIAQGMRAEEGTGAFRMSIGMNNDCLAGRPLAEVDDATVWVVTGDNQQGIELNLMFGMAYGNPDCCWGLSTEDQARFYAEPSFRSKYAPHLGGLNLGFADGHAKWWQAEAAVTAAGNSVCCGDGEQCVQTEGTIFKGMCPFYEVNNTR
jgi:prepilin-type N-terminal cleavage/methylation domain-containing protein/prepilin-type processing-associated H-X9-DG protein